MQRRVRRVTANAVASSSAPRLGHCAVGQAARKPVQQQQAESGVAAANPTRMIWDALESRRKHMRHAPGRRSSHGGQWVWFRTLQTDAIVHFSRFVFALHEFRGI